MAIKYRLPASSTSRAFADIGGLTSYGADGPVSFRHGAIFVQRILQRKQPKDIPVEQPTNFALILNLTTAKGARSAKVKGEHLRRLFRSGRAASG